MTERPNIAELIEMLRYRRPEGSATQRAFVDRYLAPCMTEDRHGNFMAVIGDAPRVLFCAHHDTVHRADGMQRVIVRDGVASLPVKSTSTCLGADCTAGIWLMLHMMRRGVPGAYVVHAGEEIGGVGSAALVADAPAWLDGVQACIAFDRYGSRSVITHQGYGQTASEAFALSLAAQLGGGYEPDDGGTFTDSANYADVVPECTNLSVGYYNQHRANETQDLRHAARLASALVAADWSALTIERKPGSGRWQWEPAGLWEPAGRGGVSQGDELDDMAILIQDHPWEIADLLSNLGYSVSDLLDECRITPDCYKMPAA